MDKKKTLTMDIRTAVSATEVEILRNNGGFFIDTDFGRVCIETNADKSINPVHPVTVVPWSEAPDSPFAVDKCENDQADYWASINVFGSQITDHLSIIEIFIRMMFHSLGITDTGDDLVDAAVYLYVASYDSYSININMIEKEFRKNHLRKIKRGNKQVMQSIIRELFLKKIESAERVYRQSEKLLKQYLEDDKREVNFYDEFCRELFGIILYANRRVKEENARSYKMLVAYNDEMMDKDRSFDVYKSNLNN